MVWLVASKDSLTPSIIFKSDEILSYENYIEVVLSHAQSKDKRLLGNEFIYQQDNTTLHTHKAPKQFCSQCSELLCLGRYLQ
jgi:hypothetical protein